MRLIDADEIQYRENTVCYGHGLYLTERTVSAETIAKMPTVDTVEVVHGHKVVRERNRGIAYAMKCPICNGKIPSNKPYTEKVEYCSVCGKKLDDTFQNYCPNCGAKMDGGSENA